VMFKGEVAEPGFGHFSKCRPKFYQNVLDLSGVALYQGTINIRIDGEMPHFPMLNTRRIPGQDQIDLDHNQDILITPCVMEGRPGFWILPVFKGTWDPNPAGHFPKNTATASGHLQTALSNARRAPRPTSRFCENAPPIEH
jgi:hypothetical protein